MKEHLQILLGIISFLLFVLFTIICIRFCEYLKEEAD